MTTPLTLSLSEAQREEVVALIEKRASIPGEAWNLECKLMFALAADIRAATLPPPGVSAPWITGFAVRIKGGDLDIRTTGPTDISAMVNWLCVNGCLMLRDASDNRVREEFARNPNAELIEVVIVALANAAQPGANAGKDAAEAQHPVHGLDVCQCGDFREQHHTFEVDDVITGYGGCDRCKCDRFRLKAWAPSAPPVAPNAPAGNAGLVREALESASKSPHNEHYCPCAHRSVQSGLVQAECRCHVGKAQAALSRPAVGVDEMRRALVWIEQNDRVYLSHTEQTERIIERYDVPTSANKLLVYGEAGWRAREALSNSQIQEAKP